MRETITPTHRKQRAQAPAPSMPVGSPTGGSRRPGRDRPWPPRGRSWSTWRFRARRSPGRRISPKLALRAGEYAPHPSATTRRTV